MNEIAPPVAVHTTGEVLAEDEGTDSNSEPGDDNEEKHGDALRRGDRLRPYRP